ncbi:molybdopterin-synthase adenylyltransferase MoeB [Neomicrococcus lactis]
MTGFSPLVSPAADLSQAEIERYSRQIILPGVGLEGQKRLKNARVLIVGAGGLGAPTIMYLAAAGVGTLGIIDDDTVDSSNLQRQVIHREDAVGTLKVESAESFVAGLNPHVTTVTHAVRLDASNILEIFRGYDVVLDGTDNFATRYLVNDAAAIVGIPLIWGSILRFDGQVSVFWNGVGPTYRDLYPEAPPAGLVPSCAEAGVFGVLCAQIGSVMASEAIKLITGIGKPLIGRVLILDALETSWTEVTLEKDPETVQPAELLEDYPAFCGMPTKGEEHVTVPEIDVHELKELLKAREANNEHFELIDVREVGEAGIARIPGATLIPRADILSGDVTLPQDKRIILHCKSGGRSAEVGRYLLANGYENIQHVRGGVNAWIDSGQPGGSKY